MKGFRALFAGALAGFCVAFAAFPVRAAAPIHFADLNWESGSLITELLRHIVEKGYGLPTDKLPGTTVTLETALAKNDIQVIGEEWAGRSPVWVKAEAAGEVLAVGDTVKGATEGWWVPEYVIKGDAERGIPPLAPDLRSVEDLKRYPAVFADPELGKFKLVQLQEPAFDAEAWKTLTDADNPNPKPTRSLASRLSIGVSTPFRQQYPQVVEFFAKVDLPIDLLNRALAKMSEERLPPDQVARAFLKDNPQVWQAWVPADVAQKVMDSL